MIPSYFKIEILAIQDEFVLLGHKGLKVVSRHSLGSGGVFILHPAEEGLCLALYAGVLVALLVAGLVGPLVPERATITVTVPIAVAIFACK